MTAVGFLISGFHDIEHTEKAEEGGYRGDVPSITPRLSWRWLRSGNSTSGGSNVQPRSYVTPVPRGLEHQILGPLAIACRSFGCDEQRHVLQGG